MTSRTASRPPAASSPRTRSRRWSGGRTGSIRANGALAGHGRVHGPFRLPKREPYPVSLEQSIPPSWAGPGWRQQYEGKPVRLEITCRRDGHGPWTLRYEVDVKPDPAGQVF